ncbi:MAG: hypothetical protein AAFO79_11700, partial [Pseudomonadota bacterium]
MSLSASLLAAALAVHLQPLNLARETAPTNVAPLQRSAPPVHLAASTTAEKASDQQDPNARYQALYQRFQKALGAKRFFKAEQAAAEGIALSKDAFPDNPIYGANMHFLRAVALASGDRNDEAVTAFDTALEIYKATTDLSSPTALNIIHQYVLLLRKMRRDADALPLIRTRLEILKTQLSLSGEARLSDERRARYTADYDASLGQLAFLSGRARQFDASATAYAELYARSVATHGERDPKTHDIATGVAMIASARGNHRQADAVLAREATLQPGKSFAGLLGDHGTALRSLGLFDAAASYLARVIALRANLPDPIAAQGRADGLLEPAAVTSIGTGTLATQVAATR